MNTRTTMNIVAARKWFAGAFGAATLLLGTVQLASATNSDHANRPPRPTTTTVTVTETLTDNARVGQPNLYTSDIATMSRFYQRLGFTELYTFPGPDGQPAFATLQKGSMFLTLTTYDMIRESTGLPNIGRSRLHQGDITILVEDVDATVGTMQAAGYRVLMQPKTQPWGERQAYIADPEGNYVMISTHSE
ncbi:MAG TPA: VOC family protein [Pseudonocardiaceae bacterium]